MRSFAFSASAISDGSRTACSPNSLTISTFAVMSSSVTVFDTIGVESSLRAGLALEL